MSATRDTTLLVIDDDPNVHELVDFHLEGVVDEMIHAVLPGQGIKMAGECSPDVILLDIDMPKMDGFQVCRKIRECESARDIPILFLTKDKSVHHIAKALDTGGTDYVTKPFHAIELQARVRVALRTKRLVDLLKEHGRIDALTGLNNRGAFDEGLDAAFANHVRNGQPFGLLLLDLDHFKSVNDTHGHGIGDEVLRQAGVAIRSMCRPYDLAARYGGEEFAIIFNQTEADDVERIALRLLDRIREIVVAVGENELRITTSAGLACASEESSTVNGPELLSAADAALYEAKNQGRDRLVAHRPAAGRVS